MEYQQPKELVDKLYKAFQRHDGNEMADCYHHEAAFSDPVFPSLHGSEIGNMWYMLCKTAKDLSISFNIEPGDIANSVIVNWHARYLFSKTGRQVHNIVQATIRIQDGKIIEHRDDFNFWRWSKQALGPIGFILGWTSFLQHKVQTQAKRSLEKFYAQN